VEVDVPDGGMYVSEPKLSLALLWKRMLAGRPQKPMLDCTRARAAQDFEKGYAESIAFHKKRKGVPAEREAAAVAKDARDKDSAKAA